MGETGGSEGDGLRNRPSLCIVGGKRPSGPIRGQSRPRMIRSIPTLHGTALAVSALLIATAALAFDAGRTACPSHPAQSAPIARGAV